MAPFEGPFDVNETSVCDELPVNSPMVSGRTEDSFCVWDLAPFQVCLGFVEEVKSVEALGGSSLRHIWTIAWALNKYG